MAQYMDPDNYSEMISALNTFITQVSESCDEMESAGNECVENMENDPHAAKHNEKLGTCIAKYRETLETAQQLISAMQEELDELLSMAPSD